VIVDLAVEDGDHIPILAAHWLVAAFEVDNLQPNRAKRYIPRLIDPVLVGTAVREGGDDPAKNTRVYSMISMSVTRNSAQSAKSPFLDIMCIL
jgi:hypothetical protein